MLLSGFISHIGFLASQSGIDALSDGIHPSYNIPVIAARDFRHQRLVAIVGPTQQNAAIIFLEEAVVQCLVVGISNIDYPRLEYFLAEILRVCDAPNLETVWVDEWDNHYWASDTLNTNFGPLSVCT